MRVYVGFKVLTRNKGVGKVANEKYMPWTGDGCFLLLIWPPFLKTIFPFLLTPAKLIDDYQTIVMLMLTVSSTSPFLCFCVRSPLPSVWNSHDTNQDNSRDKMFQTPLTN
jgi:hypothetical protein